MTRNRFVARISAADDPEVGGWLAALEEARRDTLKVLDEVPADAVDRDPGDGGDSIGTVLYHVALIEADWVFTDVLDREADIGSDLFPADDRTEDGHLSQVRGETLAQHLDRLATIRSRSWPSCARCPPRTSTGCTLAPTTTCRPRGSSST